jgi:glucose-1-phosphate adenylyltransferase
MDLLSENPPLNLQDSGWPILTQIQNRPPTRIEIGARVSHSLLSGGCVIEGTVEYAILSPGVYVGPGAVVRNSIVMHNTTIEECARVQNTILDMDVTIGQQAQVGVAQRYAPTSSTPVHAPVTVVEKGAHINTGTVIALAEMQDEIVLRTTQQANAHTA